MLDATVDPPTAALLTQLADWVNEHGSAEVPQSGRSRLDPPGERPLGKRLYYARSKYARGTLPAPVTRALERFPGWTWTPYQATLDRHLAALDTHFRVQDRTTRLGPAGRHLRLAEQCQPPRDQLPRLSRPTAAP